MDSPKPASERTLEFTTLGSSQGPIRGGYLHLDENLLNHFLRFGLPMFWSAWAQHLSLGRPTHTLFDACSPKHSCKWMAARLLQPIRKPGQRQAMPEALQGGRQRCRITPRAFAPIAPQKWKFPRLLDAKQLYEGEA